MSIDVVVRALAVVLAALLPIVTTFLLIQATRWDRHADVTSVAFRLALSVGLGLGLSSCAFFLALVLFDGTRRGAIAVDVLWIAAAGAATWLLRRLGYTRAVPRSDRSADAWLSAAVAFAALTAAVTFVLNAAGSPHGEWDAWAIWNFRARWLFRAGSAWATTFSETTIHGDYPLLLPATVARLWAYAGADPTRIPISVAAAYGAALVVLLYGSVDAVRGRVQGLLAALSLLGTPVFLRSTSWQYADIPLACAMLAALALLAMRDHDPACGPSVYVWAGVAAGLAAWTKNEGLLFVLCLVVVRIALALAARTTLRAAPWFVAGLLPAGIAVAAFKIGLAPPTYEFAAQDPAEVWARITDVGRYWIIARAAEAAVIHDGGILLAGMTVYLVLLGRTADHAARRTAAAIIAVLALVGLGYAAVYLTTPADLEWQLGHSIDRLVLQLWPSALLAFWLYAARPADLTALADGRVRRPPATSRRRSRKGRRRD